jgi:tetratricopeptide (TPR) repeat protein
MPSIAELQSKFYNKEFYEKWEKKELALLESDSANAMEHHKSLGFIYEIMHRHDECVEHCEKAIALAKQKTQRADARVSIARSYVFRKEINMAIAQYLTAFDEDPEHDAVLEELGHCYRHLKDYDNAMHWYTLLGKQEGMEACAFTNVGDLCVEKKEYDNAIDYYNKALMFEEKYEGAIHGLGVACAETGRSGEAMEHFKKELELNPRSAQALYCTGLVYQNREDYYRALHYYTEALKVWPGFAEVYNNMAFIHLEMDSDIRTAIAEVEKAADLATDSQQRVLFYLNLSRLYNKIKDEKKHIYWKSKLMEELGFGGISFDEDDEDGDILK